MNQFDLRSIGTCCAPSAVHVSRSGCHPPISVGVLVDQSRSPDGFGPQGVALGTPVRGWYIPAPRNVGAARDKVRMANPTGVRVFRAAILHWVVLTGCMQTQGGTRKLHIRPSFVCSQRSSSYLLNSRRLGLVPRHAYLEPAVTLENNWASHVHQGTTIGESKEHAVCTTNANKLHPRCRGSGMKYLS